MDKLIVKYGVMFAITVFVFANFIACGARMYKVSLVEDHDARSIPRHAHDPESKYFGIHAVDGWKELPIHFKVSYELNEQQIEGLKRAMETWEIAVGKKLFVFEGVHKLSGDSFNDLYSSLTDNINGHYLDSDWQKTGKSQMVLATTIWSNDNNNTDQITTADIRFNSQYYLIGNSYKIDQRPNDAREIVDMESLALHELGHLLGLSHIKETEDPNSIMNPSLYIGEGLTSRSLSRGDIERMQRIYSCEDSACDIDTVLTKLEEREKTTSSEESEYFANSFDKQETTAK